MGSIIGGLNLRKVQSINSQSYNSSASPAYDDYLEEWCLAFAFVARLIVCFATLTLFAIVAYMVIKYLSEFEEEEGMGDVRAGAEIDPLQPAGKSMPLTYGTCHEWDIESGNCSSSSSRSNSSDSIIASSSEDLYDGKICVICYTEQRDCFLVPCGHCATCYVCAQRIFYGEIKTCPICRRFIRKVRKLFPA